MGRTAVFLVVGLACLTVLLAGPAPAGPLQPEWFTHLVYDQQTIVAEDMDVDGAGMPHLAFAHAVPNATVRDSYDLTLTYAHWDTGWVLDDVVTTLVSEPLFPNVEVAVSVDAGGQPDLYLYKGSGVVPGGLDVGLHHFAPLPAGGWTHAWLGWSGWRPLEAAQRNGIKAVVSHMPGWVRYSEYDGGWAPAVTIAELPYPAGGCIGSSAAIAFNSSGVPHVVYGGGNRLYLATRTSGTWTSEVLADFSPDCIYFTGVGIAIDADDVVHVAAAPSKWGSSMETPIVYYRGGPGDWTSEVVPVDVNWYIGPQGTYASFRVLLDPAGTPYVAFNAGTSNVGLIHRHEGGWEQDVVAPGSLARADFDFSFRLSDGAGALAWISQTNGALYFSTQRELGPDGPPAAPLMLPAELAGGGLAPTDVRISWVPSADDGRGEGDVAGYEVRYGTAYQPTGAGYTVLATLPPGTASYTHVGAGADGMPYFYQVRALETGGRSTPAAGQAAKLVHALSAGWNLVSVPLEVADWSVPALFRNLPCSLLRTYSARTDEWLTVDLQRGTKAFDALDRTTAVWVRLDAAANMTVAGAVPSSTLLPLVSGWNLVGYPSVTTRSVSNVLGGATWRAVEGFADLPPYYLRRLGPTDMMTPWSGYWILVEASAILSVQG